ncbi:hypothetical protein Pcinc_044376 [Petrolisthes cinctipes]|uniref:Uncharacterized protein n=1 Tax=Petrolisthes cinctipes TaxID=88211 RepID=A0AAE1BED9_PETCI|nr:hypothetical protein Pcinc_044376 [Petrolisthes cinctipes]
MRPKRPLPTQREELVRVLSRYTGQVERSYPIPRKGRARDEEGGKTEEVNLRKNGLDVCLAKKAWAWGVRWMQTGSVKMKKKKRECVGESEGEERRQQTSAHHRGLLRRAWIPSCPSTGYPEDLKGSFMVVNRCFVTPPDLTPATRTGHPATHSSSAPPDTPFRDPAGERTRPSSCPSSVS